MRIKDGDQWKAAFITNKGLFEPTVMFFGLTNSPATFQAMMNTIFANEMAQGWLTVYMDDMMIATKPEPGETEQQHKVRHCDKVKQVLQILQDHNLFLQPKKCEFEKTSTEFLGIWVEKGTIHMDNKKVDKVKNWSAPKTVKQVCEFLGFTGYYRRFIQDYSTLARPLLDLTKKTTPWHWKDRQQLAFEALHDRMCSKPILQQPNFERKFYLETDASAYGMGAVLKQEGKPFTSPATSLTSKTSLLHPVAYYSATFTLTEHNYNIYERELLAIIKALEHW